jgi:hypothetical protein
MSIVNLTLANATYDFQDDSYRSTEEVVHNIAIRLLLDGVVLMKFTPDNSDALIRSLQKGEARDGYEWDVSNSSFSFKVDKVAGLVTWECGCYGGGEAGGLEVRTPFNQTLVETLDAIAKIIPPCGRSVLRTTLDE